MDIELNPKILKDAGIIFPSATQKVIFNYETSIVKYINLENQEIALDFTQSHQIKYSYIQQLLTDARNKGLVQ
jgi:hypothetical protein